MNELMNVRIMREENPLMAQHLGKYRSLMPSVALIIHVVELAAGKSPGPVSEQAALLAVQWCDFLEAHARRIYALCQNPEHEAAVRLAEKIKAGKLPNPFSIAVIQRKGWHGLTDKTELRAACEILIGENWLMRTRETPTGKQGRPSAPEYHITPFLFSK